LSTPTTQKTRREQKLRIINNKLMTMRQLCLWLAVMASLVEGFSVLEMRARASTTRMYATTTVAPPDEKTMDDILRSRRYGEDPDEFYGNNDGEFLEYLIDDRSVSRKDEDPFHILLLGSTFDEKKMTVNYVANSLSYVLDMPESEGKSLAESAETNGMACLGTWARKECLELGTQLRNRDLVCRVVPFCEGGSRSWQARDADAGGVGAESGGGEYAYDGDSAF